MDMTNRPNFLFIITDQQRGDHLSCANHPVLKTPNIDSIAARGTLFNKFHVATPVCQPNRSTLLTGRMPSLHGVRSNGIPLDMRASTFTEGLRTGGYRTALVGKSHIQNISHKNTYTRLTLFMTILSFSLLRKYVAQRRLFTKICLTLKSTFH